MGTYSVLKIMEWLVPENTNSANAFTSQGSSEASASPERLNQRTFPNLYIETLNVIVQYVPTHSPVYITNLWTMLTVIWVTSKSIQKKICTKLLIPKSSILRPSTKLKMIPSPRTHYTLTPSSIHTKNRSNIQWISMYIQSTGQNSLKSS